MDVRLLTPDDAPAFQALRLRSLREHPDVFGSSVEEQAARSLDQIVEQIKRQLPDSPTFGAFVDGVLIGIGGLSRSTMQKTRHRAMVRSMYVAPEGRRHGAGRMLLAAIIAYARTQHGLEDLYLTVTVGNTARLLYLGMGFTPYGVEPRHLKVGDQYYDMEQMLLHL